MRITVKRCLGRAEEKGFLTQSSWIQTQNVETNFLTVYNLYADLRIMYIHAPALQKLRCSLDTLLYLYYASGPI